MPENNQKPRVIRATLPTKTGSYAASTTPQLHGKGRTKTDEFLAELHADDPGTQGFYREAITVPHPLENGKTLSYGALQRLMNGPQKVAALEAYRAANRLPQTPTAEAYQQAMFDLGRQQLVARGAANPGAYAFPDAAVDALRSPTKARLIRSGNFVTGEQAGQVITEPMLAQRAADLPADGNLMAAPGMPVRVLRGTARPTAPSSKIIPGTLASR